MVSFELKVLLEEVVERAPVRLVEAVFLVLRARDALRICWCSARPCVDHEGSDKNWRRLRNFNPPSLPSHHDSTLAKRFFAFLNSTSALAPPVILDEPLRGLKSSSSSLS